jgi:hypothetical protein
MIIHEVLKNRKLESAWKAYGPINTPRQYLKLKWFRGQVTQGNFILYLIEEYTDRFYLWYTMNSLQLQARAILELKQRGVLPDYVWPSEYTSKRTGQPYQLNTPQVRQFIDNDTPRYALLKGGEGGGKSAAGVIKDLNRLRRGCNGIMVSTDLEHFKKSIWPTFKEWCPWHCVIPSQRRRQAPSWEPSKVFTMVLKNEVGGYSELVCGGAKLHSFR